MHPLAQPRLKSITVNVGIGRLKAQGGDEVPIIKALMKITGQKPKPTTAKKAIAGFKVRQGAVVGLQVTLRGRRMIDFFTRLITIVLPRVRDFRGIERKTVSGGVVSFGLEENTAFPELAADDTNFGMNISIATSATSAQNTETFLRELGFPLRKEKSDDRRRE